MVFVAVPLFFLWLGLWMWRREMRMRRAFDRIPILVVTEDELQMMLASQASEDAAMVRTLHQIRELEEAQ